MTSGYVANNFHQEFMYRAVTILFKKICIQSSDNRICSKQISPRNYIQSSDRSEGIIYTSLQCSDNRISIVYKAETAVYSAVTIFIKNCIQSSDNNDVFFTFVYRAVTIDFQLYTKQ